MDDDVQLVTADKTSTQNPWRMYKKSLKTFQPAVVSIFLGTKQGVSQMKVFPSDWIVNSQDTYKYT